MTELIMSLRRDRPAARLALSWIVRRAAHLVLRLTGRRTARLTLQEPVRPRWLGVVPVILPLALWLLIALPLVTFFEITPCAAQWVTSKDKNGEKKQTRKRLVKKRRVQVPPAPIGIIYAPGYSFRYNRRDPRYFNGLNGPGDYSILDNRRYRYPNPRFSNDNSVNPQEDLNNSSSDTAEEYPLGPRPYNPLSSPRSQFFWSFAGEFTGGRSRNRGSFDIQLGHRFFEFGEIRGGLAFVQDRRLFRGLSFGARVYSPWTITPFAGGGFFLGRFQECETIPFDDEFDQEICERFDTTRIYPEVGVLFRAAQNFRWLFFIRHHFKLNGDASPEFDPFFGLSFQYR